MISRYAQRRGRLSKEAPVHLHERRNDANADGERTLAFLAGLLTLHWRKLAGRKTHAQGELCGARHRGPVNAKTVFNGMESLGNIFDLMHCAW